MPQPSFQATQAGDAAKQAIANVFDNIQQFDIPRAVRDETPRIRVAVKFNHQTGDWRAEAFATITIRIGGSGVAPM